MVCRVKVKQVNWPYEVRNLSKISKYESIQFWDVIGMQTRSSLLRAEKRWFLIIIQMITENQSKAGNDMKSLNSIFAWMSWDRSQHLLQNDYDVIIEQGTGGGGHSLIKVCV